MVFIYVYLLKRRRLSELSCDPELSKEGAGRKQRNVKHALMGFGERK